MDAKKLRLQTLQTYNNSAEELAVYFRGIGPRAKYIDKAFDLAGNPVDPRVLEIGCGDGRDASYIVNKAGWYEGIDYSEPLIDLAKKHVPGASFKVADMVEYAYPDNLDVIFAFASLLHLDRTEVTAVFLKAAKALRQGGIFYISLKWAADYSCKVKEDNYGSRLFYFYNADAIKELAGDSFEVAETWREYIGHTDWFEIALRKV